MREFIINSRRNEQVVASLPIGRINDIDTRVKALEATPPGGASAFTDLTDAPSTYTGQATKFIRVNAGESALEFATISGGGDALTSAPLSQFAATTSLQLKGVVSDETGSGPLVFGTSPNITTPTGIVKGDVGLGNVDNTSDANKPISTATQTALDGKVDENVAITGATKTKITYDAKGLVTAGADATTADIADSTNKRYVTDANLTTIGNQSGTNTGDNAVNTLYSGLVSNATHTGDATGATALTVVKIQGKDFPTLGAGDDQKYPKYNHGTSAFVMTAITGGGDVSKVGTPVNNQVGVWTGDGTLEGDANLTFDTATDTLSTVTITASGAVTGSNLSGTNTGDNAANTTSNAYADGKVADAINDGVTTTAPSQNAVFAALALKAPLVSPSFTTPSLGVATATSINGATITSGTLNGSVTGTNTGDQTISISGDVTASGSTGALTATVTKINGTTLSGLASGILKNTTGTGVPSIAINSDLPVMSATVGGAVPTPPNNTTTFLRGDGTFATPNGGSQSYVYLVQYGGII